ncbi:MAG: tetratricopeptide repeat protein [Pirellulaceae bacterium]
MNDQVWNQRRAGWILGGLCWVLLAAGCQSPDQASLERGQELIVSQEWEQAIGHLDEAIRQSPESSLAFELRGTARLELRRFAAAAADFEQARKLAPADFRRHADLARSQLEQGNVAQAVAACDEAIALNDRNAAALLLRAKACLGDDRAAEALLDIDRLLAIEPTSAAGWTLRGAAQYRLGQDAQAEQDLNRAIEHDDANANAYWTRAQVRARLARPAEAAADRARARQLNPALELTDSGGGRSLLDGLRGASGTRDNLDPRLK